VLTSWGDPSLYEKARDIRKQVDLDRITADGFRDRAAIVTAGVSPAEPAAVVPASAASVPAASDRVVDPGPPTVPLTRADMRDSVGV